MAAISLSCEGSVIKQPKKCILTIRGHAFSASDVENIWLDYCVPPNKTNDIRLQRVRRMSKWEQEMVLLVRPILDLWFGVIQNWKRSVQTGFIKTWVYTINGAWLWLNFSGLEGYLELKNLGVRIIRYELEILEEFWDKACIYRTLWYFISNFAEQIMVMFMQAFFSAILLTAYIVVFIHVIHVCNS